LLDCFADFGLRAMVGLLENHHRPAHKNPDTPPQADDAPGASRIRLSASQKTKQASQQRTQGMTD
jgi:hypothetical protein